MRSGMIVLCAPLVFACAGCAPGFPLPSDEAASQIQLPADEFPHGFGQAEWWYYSGRLESEGGRGFGIQAVIFHVPPGVVPTLADTWIAHYSVLDQATGSFAYDQSSEARPFPPRIMDMATDFSVQTALVQMTGREGAQRLTAVMRDGNYGLDLMLTDTRGPVLHGDGGHVPYGGGENRSFYYSRPTVSATGTLVIEDQPTRVSGSLWFDRQWGRDLRNPWLPWDWFSLRLDDGTRVMLYVFRDTQPPVAYGTFVPPIGDPVPLTRDEFTIAPTASWTSPHTSRTYPVAWEIRLPVQNLTVSVTATVDDQELDTRPTTLNVYWEGLCELIGTQGTRDVNGWAYVELTNYPIDGSAVIADFLNRIAHFSGNAGRRRLGRRRPPSPPGTNPRSGPVEDSPLVPPMLLQKEALEAGNPLATYAAMLDLEQRYRNSKALAGVYAEVRLNFEEFLGFPMAGVQAMALPNFRQPSAADGRAIPEGFEPEAALTVVEREARKTRIVIWAEEHHLPQSRSLFEPLLRALREQGYRYLAAETFADQVMDPQFHYPDYRSG
jgi:predicted secreted hydrolase